FELPGAYHPSPKLLATAREFPRWLEGPVAGRANYITPAFALGTSNHDYMAQDRLFTLQFAAVDGLPDVSLNINNDVDAVYGAATVDPSGHVKTHHLTPIHPAVAQDHDAVLFLYELAPPAAAASELTANLVLPLRLALNADSD